MVGPPFFTPGMGPGPVQPAYSHSPMRSVPRQWLVSGYTSAYDRFLAASQHPDRPEDLYVALFETLNWAGALEEKLRPHKNQLLLAIRFVRNRVLHDWADAVEGRNVPNAQVARQTGAGVMVSGSIPPPVVWEWFWRNRQHIPSSRVQPHGGPAYDMHLSEKPVREALHELRRLF